MGIEFKKLKNKRSVSLMIIMAAIPFIDLFINWQASYADYFFHPDAYGSSPPPYAFHPVAASFLCGNSVGHLSQMLLVWILPLFLLLIYSGSVVTEKNQGYLNIIYTKREKRVYVHHKIATAFLVGFFVIFISLMLNFGLARLLFASGTSFGGLEEMVGQINGLFDWSIRHPYTAYFFYIVATSTISGVISAISISMAFLLPNNWALYPAVFFTWLLLIINPFSITYAMQPFIEFGVSTIAISLAMLLCIAIAAGVATEFHIRRKDVFS